MSTEYPPEEERKMLEAGWIKKGPGRWVRPPEEVAALTRELTPQEEALADGLANVVGESIKAVIAPIVKRLEKIEGFHIDMQKLCNVLERDGPAKFRKEVERHAEHLKRLQTDVSSTKSKHEDIERRLRTLERKNER